MQQTLSIALIIVALFATYTLPAKALNGNTCTVEYLSRGTYITQTAGKAGTINAYAGNAYKTTVMRLNQRWYVTNQKDVAVWGEDAGGIVC